MASPRVLIVEDVEEMRELLGQVVEAAGFQVSAKAGNVWEARLELGRRKPDLILLDEILPGESSLDLLAEAGELGVPVLLVTGVENPTHAVPSGALGRLSKPDWDTLRADTERFSRELRAALASSQRNHG